MPIAEIVGDKIAVQTHWNEKELIKQIPGSRWNPEDRVWTLPLTWSSCVQLRGFFHDTLDIGELLTLWSWKEYRDRIEPALKLRNATRVIK